jgi:hypothetical protein
MATIADCKIDPEFRDLIPVATWDERADLEASVRAFGFLSPIIVWTNEHGELVLLDGHSRWELWRAAVANPDNAGRAAIEPAVVVVDLPSRDDARLWIINAQLARRNVDALDRIALVSKRQEIVTRLAKENQSKGGGDKKSWAFKSLFKSGSPALAKAIPKVDCREVAALEARVSNGTYSDGMAVLSAVDDGKLSAEVLQDIRSGKASIHGVAKSLKGKPKSKASGLQTIVRQFTATVRRAVKRDPQRRAEIVAALRAIADEFERQQASVAA